jgi:hypothetical protein
MKRLHEKDGKAPIFDTIAYKYNPRGRKDIRWKK